MLRSQVLSVFIYEINKGGSTQPDHTMPHSPKSNSSPYALRLFVQTHIRDAQGQRRYHLADVRNPLQTTANTKAGESTDMNHNYTQRETSVNFAHAEATSD